MIPGLYEERKPKPLRACKPLRRGGGIQRGGKRIRRAVGIDYGEPKRYHPAGLKSALTLKRVGKRGRRLAAGDRRISAMFREMDCICGCSATPDPAHLRTRRDESTRHQEHLIIPMDRIGHNWLDQHPDGVRCREQLFLMAQTKGDHLTHAEVWPVLDAFGFYGYAAEQRRHKARG